MTRVDFSCRNKTASPLNLQESPTHPELYLRAKSRGSMEHGASVKAPDAGAVAADCARPCNTPPLVTASTPARSKPFPPAGGARPRTGAGTTRSMWRAQSAASTAPARVSLVPARSATRRPRRSAATRSTSGSSARAACAPLATARIRALWSSARSAASTVLVAEIPARARAVCRRRRRPASTQQRCAPSSHPAPAAAASAPMQRQI